MGKNVTLTGNVNENLFVDEVNDYKAIRLFNEDGVGFEITSVGDHSYIDSLKGRTVTINVNVD